MGTLRKLSLSIMCSLFLVLSSCKTITRVENTEAHIKTERLFNRRGSSKLSVSSPSVDVRKALSEIGYIDLMVVNNKDTLNVKVTNENIILDAIISEREFEVKETVVENIEKQVQGESKPQAVGVTSNLKTIFVCISIIVVIILMIRIWKKVNA